MPATRARITAPPNPLHRQSVVAPFILKLTDIINHGDNAGLIYWSDSDDSFIVTDTDRFAHTVLPRWYKHKNWSSFVRQLNIYGFRKIPQLHQGALHPPHPPHSNHNGETENETADQEIWEFAHINFVRGRPELVNLIKRRERGAAQQQVQSSTGSLHLTRAQDENNASDNENNNNNVDSDGEEDDNSNDVGEEHASPLLDLTPIHSLTPIQLLNILQTLTQHQRNLSAELSDLKRSNQILHQESLDTRCMIQKQRETITRILKFLAGVFTASSGTATTATTSSARLMIEGSDHDDHVANSSIGRGIDPARRTTQNLREPSRRPTTATNSDTSIEPEWEPKNRQFPTLEGAVVVPGDEIVSGFSDAGTITREANDNDGDDGTLMRSHQIDTDNSTTSSSSNAALQPPTSSGSTIAIPSPTAGGEYPLDISTHSFTPEQLADYWMAAVPHNLGSMYDLFVGLSSDSEGMLPLPPPPAAPPPSLRLEAGEVLGTPEGLISFSDTYHAIIDTIPAQVYPSYNTTASQQHQQQEPNENHRDDMFGPNYDNFQYMTPSSMVSNIPAVTPTPTPILASALVPPTADTRRSIPSSPFAVDVPPPNRIGFEGLNLDLEQLLGGDMGNDASANMWPDPANGTDIDRDEIVVPSKRKSGCMMEESLLDSEGDSAVFLKRRREMV